MNCKSNDNNDVLFSFGLITDIQYADIDDRQNHLKTKWRRYRNALSCVQKAVAHWKAERPSPMFITQLGDIIDGFNSTLVDATDNERNFSREALDAVLNEFSKLPANTPVIHNIGNHELYNFSRGELEKSILHPASSCLHLNETIPMSGRDESKPFYFSFTPHPKFCFVYLDSYEISILGVDKSSKQYKEALDILHKFNQNVDLHSPEGLIGLERRFVKFNGAISRVQLSWLHTVLTQAENEGQKAVIFSHVPFYPDIGGPITLLWNYHDVLEVLWQYRCVVACFHGHTHERDYAKDDNGIHHCVFDAVVEAPLDSNAFATLLVKDDSIVIKGFGIIPSQVLKFHDS